jgi:tetratricopeptide (TPR) repeat protein
MIASILVIYWVRARLNEVFEKADALQAKKIEAAITPVPTITAQLTLPPGLEGISLQTMQLIHARFNAGDFGAALALADKSAVDEALSADFQTWLGQQMPILLVSAGWLQIKLGNCDEAVNILKRSDALARDVHSAKGLAFCAYKLKNMVLADEQFSYYLKQNPNDAELSLLYADLLESDLRFDDAVRVLEDSKKLRPNDEALAQKIASMQAKISESSNQNSTTSEHITLTYRSEEHEGLVESVLQILESAIDEYAEKYGFQVPKQTIEVILYPEASYRDVVNAGPAWTEGIFDGRMRIPIKPAFVAEPGMNTLRRILRHELSHALLAYMTDFREIPSWFNEGLAQRLECEDGCNRQFFPATPGKFLSQESLLVPYSSYAAIKAERSYRQSLYLIYVLEHDEYNASEDVLMRLVQPLHGTSNLTSDGILGPVGLTFAALHKKAEKLWDRRKLF